MVTDPLKHREEAVEPELAVIDPHHHVWDELTHSLATPYTFDQLIEDRNGGHRIVATVYAECSSHWRTDGPEELRPVGETEWIAGQDLPEGVMASIVGYADLRLGNDVRPVLEAHRAAAGDRFAGIRHSTAWDPHDDVPNTARAMPPGTLTTPRFVAGVRVLGRLGMTFDGWMYFHQIPELIQLAQMVPEVTMVLDHLGGPAGIGHYGRDRAAMLSVWRENITAVAKLPNVVLKVGGLGFPWFVPDDVVAAMRASDDIARYWRSEVEFAIDAFGPDRSMFESDFPVDSRAGDYITLWNAFKKLSRGYSPDERTDLLAGTAARVYGLEEYLPQRGRPIAPSTQRISPAE